MKEKKAINIIAMTSGKLGELNIEKDDCLDLNAVTVQSPLKALLNSNLIRGDAPVMPTEPN